MKFLVVSFLLVAVASARPNSLLRPGMDNSELLKPALEEPAYASIHTMARPKIPTLLEALEQTANIHEISRPMIPDFGTAIGQLPIEQPSIMPLPIEIESTKPLVQIFVNVADPSLVEVIGPDTPAIGTFPLMPILPSGPVGTFPELDLTKPSVIESILESLLRPNLVEQVPEINTFPLMPVILPPAPAATLPLMPDITKPQAAPVFRPATSLIR